MDQFEGIRSAIALQIPDVCSSLETTSEETARFRIERRYVGWCEKYLEKHFYYLTPADIWALRGGVLHNGMISGHPKQKYTKVYFTLPVESGNIAHENISENKNDIMLGLDLTIFCKIIIEAARAWAKETSANEVVLNNYPHLVRLRPDGMEGILLGLPVIA